MYKELIYHVLDDLVSASGTPSPLVKSLIAVMMKTATEDRAKYCYELISKRITEFEDSRSYKEPEKLAFKL